MTFLLSIATILVLITICWIMAKYNKSDNLFWILLISLFAGMAGGAIFNKLNKETVEEMNTNFEQVYNPTQVSQADISFCNLPENSLASKAEPVGQDSETTAFGIEVNIAPSKVYGEIRGQPLNIVMNTIKIYHEKCSNNFNPFHIGNPGMPYDTS